MLENARPHAPSTRDGGHSGGGGGEGRAGAAAAHSTVGGDGGDGGFAAAHSTIRVGGSGGNEGGDNKAKVETAIPKVFLALPALDMNHLKGRGLKPKKAFAAIYKTLLGKTSGPKAGPFIAGLPPEEVRQRFSGSRL